MKIFMVSHTCMSRTMGQPKLHALAADPGTDLTVLVPDRMFTYGRWGHAEPPAAADFRFVVGRTRLRNVLNQWYLLHYDGILAKLLAETQPDVIDVWEEPWSLACAQTLRLARRLCPSARIVVETEQNIFKRLPPPFPWFQSYSLARADLMVARNREAVDVLRRKGYDGPVEVIPNAVDCGLFRPLQAEERGARRQELGWAGDFVSGYVGRLVPEKGLSDAVAALALLPANHRLVFVGDGPMRAGLAAQAASLGVTDRVVFAGGRPLDDLPEVIGALDVLVLPSRTTSTWKEQFGRVLIEAGACGVPVVGSDSGAIPEVVDGAGLIFPEGDAAALAACLRRLECDPALRGRLARAGTDRSGELFSWQRVADRMLGLYRNVLADRGEAQAVSDSRRGPASDLVAGPPTRGAWLR